MLYSVKGTYQCLHHHEIVTEVVVIFNLMVRLTKYIVLDLYNLHVIQDSPQVQGGHEVEGVRYYLLFKSHLCTCQEVVVRKLLLFWLAGVGGPAWCWLGIYLLDLCN